MIVLFLPLSDLFLHLLYFSLDGNGLLRWVDGGWLCRSSDGCLSEYGRGNLNGHLWECCWGQGVPGRSAADPFRRPVRLHGCLLLLLLRLRLFRLAHKHGQRRYKVLKVDLFPSSLTQRELGRKLFLMGLGQ